MVAGWHPAPALAAGKGCGKSRRFASAPAPETGNLTETHTMKITTKLGLLFAGMITVFVLLGVTLLAQMKLVSNGYDALLASPVRDIDAARVVQVNFRRKSRNGRTRCCAVTILRTLPNTASSSTNARPPSVREGAVALSQTSFGTRKHISCWSNSLPPTMR